MSTLQCRGFAQAAIGHSIIEIAHQVWCCFIGYRPQCRYDAGRTLVLGEHAEPFNLETSPFAFERRVAGGKGQ